MIAGYILSKGLSVMRATIFLPAFLLFAASAASAAPGNPLEGREPGLWEIQLEGGSPVAALMQGMQQTLQNMPAAQRQQMEKMLQGSGISPAMPTSVRQCLTPEMVAQDFQPYVADPSMQCTSTMEKTSSTEGAFSFSCQKDGETWKGKGRIFDAGPKSFKSDMTMEGTVKGRPVKMDMKHEARWIGPDCQGVKPLQ